MQKGMTVLQHFSLYLIELLSGGIIIPTKNRRCEKCLAFVDKSCGLCTQG